MTEEGDFSTETGYMVDLRAYISPKLTPFTMDIFPVRRSILESLRRSLVFFSGTVLDIGCGYMPYREMVLSSSTVKEYIGLDLANNQGYQLKPDLTWDGKSIPLSDASVNCAIATELFEHCPEPEAIMREILRVLSPGGILFFTIPFLWPLHDVPHDEYRYTPFSLGRHLTNAGFHRIGLQAMGGWDESMAQMIGLFVRRRPMSDYRRFLLSLFVFPFVYMLLKLELRHRRKMAITEMPSEDFQESTMITGICGIAYKPDLQKD